MFVSTCVHQHAHGAALTFGVMSMIPSPSPPPPPPPFSVGLLATDTAAFTCYQISTDIAALFTNGEYLEPPRLSTFQDISDIATTFNNAAALAVGWIIGSTLAGACREDWLSLPSEQHQRSLLGLYRVLPAWLIGWPLAEALKFVTEAARQDGLLANLDLGAIGKDGVAVLLVAVLWRTWLLRWAANRW